MENILINAYKEKKCELKVITLLKASLKKIHPCNQGSKLKKMTGRKFATSYENLVATLKMLVAKLKTNLCPHKFKLMGQP